MLNDLKQQPNIPEHKTAEHLSQSNKFDQRSHKDPKQKQRSFKRKATQKKSSSWKGIENNICGKSS